MRRFVYAPDVQAFIVTQQFGLIDVSPDIVSGSVQRVLNGVSKMELTLHNPQRKYLRGSRTNYQPIFKPMDKFTIFMTRIYQPMQVISGFLDTVPYGRLYPNTITLNGSCTIKAIQETYWDPGLNYVTQDLKKYGWIWDWTQGVLYPDKRIWDNDVGGGLGELLREVLHDVGGWPISREAGKRNTVHILRLPESFIIHMSTLLTKQVEHLKEDKKFAEELLHFIATGKGLEGNYSDYNPLPPGQGGGGSGGTYGGGGAGTTCNGKKLPPQINDDAALAAAINKWIKQTQPDSPLNGMGATFVSQGKQYGINPMWAPAFAKVESQLGTTQCQSFPISIHNAWGSLDGNHVCMQFDSWPAGSEYFFKNLATNSAYAGKDTIEEVVPTYLGPGGGNLQSYIDQVNSYVNAMIALAGAALTCSPTGSGGGGGNPGPAGGCNDQTKKLAQQVLDYVNKGKIVIAHSEDLDDVKRSANGEKTSRYGVCIDGRVFATMIAIADKWGSMRTYAISSSHSDDSNGWGGHARGYAFDLNEVGGISFDGGYSQAAKNRDIEVLKWLQSYGSPDIRLIADNVGNVDACDPDISQYCIPPFDRWGVTCASHSNHIHICFTPGVPTS